MPAAARKKLEETIVDVAILQTQVKGLHEKIDDLKSDVRDLHDCLDKNMKDSKDLINELRTASDLQHAKLAEKVDNFEKVKYMLMGAAALLAISGWELGKEILDKFFV